MKASEPIPHTIKAMTWIGWALLSALFAAATALLAKVGVAHVDANLATAIRTTVVLVFAWGIALALGKKQYDKRADMAKQDSRRDIERALKEHDGG